MRLGFLMLIHGYTDSIFKIITGNILSAVLYARLIEIHIFVLLPGHYSAFSETGSETMSTNNTFPTTRVQLPRPPVSAESMSYCGSWMDDCEDFVWWARSINQRHHSYRQLQQQYVERLQSTSSPASIPNSRRILWRTVVKINLQIVFFVSSTNTFTLCEVWWLKG